MTSEPDYNKIQGLSYGTLSKEDIISSSNSYSTIDIVLSLVLVLIVIGIFNLLFSHCFLNELYNFFSLFFCCTIIWSR